jgi:hypothetical protein
MLFILSIITIYILHRILCKLAKKYPSLLDAEAFND